MKKAIFFGILIGLEVAFGIATFNDERKNLAHPQAQAPQQQPPPHVEMRFYTTNMQFQVPYNDGSNKGGILITNGPAIVEVAGYLLNGEWHTIFQRFNRLQ